MLRNRRTALLALPLLLAACVDDQVTAPAESSESFTPAANVLTLADLNLTGRYLLLGKNDKLPANLAASVTAAGGTLVSVMPQIGVAVAQGGAADFATKAARIAGVESVAPDVLIQWHDPEPLGRAPIDFEAEAVANVGEEVASFAD